MKKIILILIASLSIHLTVSAQSAGDYRSVGNGNWNDATKWETYNGGSWVSTTTYPGQNPGTGKVTITTETEIKITQSLPQVIGSLLVDLSWAYPDNYTIEYHYGILTYSAESAVSLNVAGDVVIPGKVRIDNLNGAKTHWLTAGGNFEVGQAVWGESGNWEPYSEESIQAINQDDKLGISFNTTNPNSQIGGPYGISFQDITFNGIGIVVSTPITILGTVTFINGIITSDGNLCPDGCGYQAYNWLPNSAGGSIYLHDDATVTGASNASFVDGYVWKWGDASFTFPIGDEGIYSPLTISAPVGHHQYSARYVRSSGSALGAISDPGLYSVSNCEYWTLNGYIDNNNPLDAIDVTVGWTSASGCGYPPDYITNVSEVTLAGFNGISIPYTWPNSGLNGSYRRDSWANHGGTGTGTTTNGSVTWSGVRTLGSFTLGNMDTGCRTPSGLNSTNITTNSATLSWSAVTGSASYDVDYISIPTGSWINAVTATTSTLVNLTNLTPSVNYEWRVRANCSSTSSSYRQSQFTMLVECVAPLGLSTTNITASGASLSWGAVTNAIRYDVEYKVSTTTYLWKPAVTGTTSLSCNLSGLSGITGYDWRVRAYCSLSSSVYSQSQFTTLNPCGTPSGLSTTNITSSSAALSWAGVPNAVSYNIEYKQSTASSWILATGGVTSLPYILGGLSASTAYDWRVYAQCYSYGGNFAQASFTTTLPVCNDVYETNNTSSQAKTISFGNAISAGISSTTDVDWFKVTTPNNSNTNLEVTLSNLHADYDLYVYNKSLKLVGSSVSTGISGEVVIYNSSARKATYYIKIAGKNGAYSTSQCYNLLVRAISSGGNRPASNGSVLANEVTEDPTSQMLYPNPASEFVYLRFNSTMEGSANVQIFNTAGQLTKQVAINITKGSNQAKIAINDIREGIYLLRINKGGLNMIRKFVIVR